MSLVSDGNSRKFGVVNAFSNLAQMEGNRKRTNDQIEGAEKQARAANAGSALGTGVGVGMMAGGPAGLAVGLGMFALGSLF